MKMKIAHNNNNNISSRKNLQHNIDDDDEDDDGEWFKDEIFCFQFKIIKNNIQLFNNNNNNKCIG